MALTLTQIRENENIKADRFGMAAISYIFKAFGDRIRSKEYWPWGRDINFPWDNETYDSYEINYNKNLLLAIECLEEAISRLNNDTETQYNDISTKSLEKRLALLKNKLKNINTISEKINETSKETKDKIDELENYE